LLLNVQAELKFAYKDLGDNSVICDFTASFFGYASFLVERENGDTILCRLHVGDVVLINIEDGENFAMIRAIFCIKKMTFNLHLLLLIGLRS